MVNKGLVNKSDMKGRHGGEEEAGWGGSRWTGEKM